MKQENVTPKNISWIDHNNTILAENIPKCWTNSKVQEFNHSKWENGTWFQYEGSALVLIRRDFGEEMECPPDSSACLKFGVGKKYKYKIKCRNNVINIRN